MPMKTATLHPVLVKAGDANWWGVTDLRIDYDYFDPGFSSPGNEIATMDLTGIGADVAFDAVGRAVLESASPGFQPGARPSQLPVQQKSPMSL